MPWKKYTVVPIAALVLSLTVQGAAQASPSDYWITTKTKIKLVTAKDLGSSAINVDTADGRVTLYGHVGSDNEKAKAAEVARGVDGVTAVRNLLVVTPEETRAVKKMRKEERELMVDVQKALQDDPGLAGSSVHTKSAAGGVVLLVGTVPNATTELHAIKVARGVDGVDGIISEIESGRETYERLPPRPAKPAPGTVSRTIEDAWITSDVKLRLMADDRTPGTDIDVDTTNGNVTLFGAVHDQGAKTAAEKVARKVDGVTGVQNALEIVPRSQEKAVEAKDDQIQKAVTDAIGARADLKDASITTQVANGVVMMSGNVPDLTVHVTAVRVVRSTPGVRSIRDNLVVK